MTTNHIVDDITDTWRIAADLAVAMVATGGGVVTLSGDLGSGKTTFTQGMARALGVKRPVTSPTFAIVSEYEGDTMRLIHMDLYRLHGPDDLEAIGFYDYLSSEALVVIEWPERAAELIPDSAVKVAIAATDERSRRIGITVPW